MMREWVANQTSGAHYIDFDALAFAPNLPVSILDILWSCAVATAAPAYPQWGCIHVWVRSTRPLLLLGSMCG